MHDFFFFLLSIITLSFVLFKKGPLEASKKVFIEKGYVLDDISNTLKSNDIIYSKLIFKILARFFSSDRALKAGEYNFENKVSLMNVFKKLKSGNTMYRKILVLEGTTVKEIVNLLLKNKYLTGQLKNIPEEGSLFPNTYFYERGENINNIIFKMSQLMKIKVNEVWKYNRGQFQKKRDLIIFASLIEAEAKKKEEKVKISSVFHNRLKINMRLQSDPTILYSKNLLLKEKVKKIYKIDIRKDSPWNTYTRNGLPTTAINNPGIDSLYAAINPINSNFLFFVSDGNGGHRFSSNLKEHNKNIIILLLIFISCIFDPANALGFEKLEKED